MDNEHRNAFLASVVLLASLLLGIVASACAFNAGAAYGRWQSAEKQLDDLRSRRIMGPCEECSRLAAEAFRQKPWAEKVRLSELSFDD